jgi:hypothetical protein
MWSFKKKKSEVITSYVVLFLKVLFFFLNGHFLKNNGHYSEEKDHFLFFIFLNDHIKEKLSQSCVSIISLFLSFFFFFIQFRVIMS